jgi:HK97 family phage major capsid protein
MKLNELQKKLAAKQDELHKVFEESKADDGTFDFTKSTTLGIDDAQNALEAVRAKNAELDDLHDQIKAVEEVEGIHDRVEEGRKARKTPSGRPAQPGSGDGKGEPTFGGKSLGQLVGESDEFKSMQKAGGQGQFTLSLEEAYPSDFFAKAAQFDTMGRKTLMTTSAGYAPESTRIPGFVESATRPIQLLDIIPVSRTGMESVVYMEETTRTHAAAEKAEGASFAESTFAFTEKNSPVRKITDSLPVTDEQLEDAAFVESYIDGRLTFGLRQRLDGQVYNGNGTSPNLEGLLNVTGIQTQAKGSDPVPDAFFKAMKNVRVTGRAMPTHHIMHPDDWQGVRLLRTADGVYIWGNPSEAGPERMWGLPVVQQDIGSANTGMVGSFMPQWVSLFERRGVDIQVGYVGTQFTEGKRTVRADMRAAFVVFRPAAFSTVTGL